MTKQSLLTHLNIQPDTWTDLPEVLTFEFSNQRYLIANPNSNNGPVKWFKVIDSGDGDPVMALQNRTRDNNPLPGGFTYVEDTVAHENIHQIFYISDISGITYK